MNPRVWFKSISLENVRSFGTKQTINFTDKDGNAARWNLILGDNGTGKTTVLRGLAYSFIENQEYISNRQGIAAYFPRIIDEPSFIETVYYNAGKDRDSIQQIKIGGKRNKITNRQHGLEELYDWYHEIKPLFLSGYGASRRIGVGAIVQPEFYSSTDNVLNSIITLFREDKSLVNAEEWLIQADYLRLRDPSYEGKFNVVYEIIEKLFRDEAPGGIMFDTSSGSPQVNLCTHYGAVRLHELSLGYKTLIAWMVDFAKGLLDRYPDSPDPLAEPAVCLVDEIDLHLHPKFQRSIIKFLTETFPNTQFIVTAHSPLIVQSAEDANIILLKREGNETHVAEGIDVHSWRIDQILSSDLFGGVSGRAPAIEERMARRRALLRKEERTPEENLELEELEEEMNDLPVMETREALKAIDIISKAVISER